MQERREYRKPGGQRWQPNEGRFLIEPKKKRTRLGPLDDQIPSYEVLLRNASGWPVWEPFSQNPLCGQPNRPLAPRIPKGMEGVGAISLTNRNCILYRLATTRIMAPTCGAFMP